MTSSMTEGVGCTKSPWRGGFLASDGPFGRSARGAWSLKTLRLLQAQQAFAHHKEVGQRAGNHQAVPVLGESSVAHLGETEDPLDHSYRMLHSHPDSRLPAIRGATAGPAVREVPRLRSTDAQHRRLAGIRRIRSEERRVGKECRARVAMDHGE